METTQTLAILQRVNITEMMEAIAAMNDSLMANGTRNYTMADENVHFVKGFDSMPVELSILIASFAALFVIGFSGNITVLYRITRTKQQCIEMYGKSGHKRISLQKYVVLLASVDLIVTSMILMLMPYLYYGEWMFGGAMCKLFWAVDQLNRMLSVLILTWMAIQRYFIVRNSIKGRRTAAPWLVTGFFWLHGLISFLPLILLLFSARANEQEMIMEHKITVCETSLPDHIFVSLTIVTFVLYYVIPVVVVAYCYLSLIHVLSKRYRITHLADNSKTRLVHKVSKSIVYVTAFHFACWTPYWIVTLTPIVEGILPKESWRPSNTTAYSLAQMFVTMSPYINSSFNWCFYVLLNKRLRKQIFRRFSTNTTTLRMKDSHSPLVAHQL